MKRIQIILSVAIILVTLSGCGNQKVQNNDNPKDTTTTESTTDNKENTNTNVKDKNDVKDKNVATQKDSNNTNSNKKENANTNTNKIEKSTNSNTNSQNTSNESSRDQKSFYGSWQIKKVAGYGKISTSEINELINSKLYLSKNLITLGNESYDNPQYQISNKTKAEMEASYKTNFSNLGINGDSITEINILDKKGEQTMTLLIKDNNTLLYFNEGVYYEAKRAS